MQDIDRVHRCCTLGMGIAKLEHRCKGYGSQAVVLMLRHAFRDLGRERVSARTLEGNLAARRSLERSGFVLEGIERKAVYLGGENAIVFAMPCCGRNTWRCAARLDKPHP